MSVARIGHMDRPDREWEVWNASYRGVTLEETPWSIWHPVIDPVTTDFPTHAQAIAYIAAGDWDA
jgi:hypothetical protein